MVGNIFEVSPDSFNSEVTASAMISSFNNRTPFSEEMKNSFQKVEALVL